MLSSYAQEIARIAGRSAVMHITPESAVAHLKADGAPDEWKENAEETVAAAR
jgi:hypothetical protein